MKKGKCWPKPRNGYREWRGWGHARKQKVCGEERESKAAPVPDPQLWRGYWILRDPPNLLQLGDFKTCLANSTISGTTWSRFLRRGAGACQGATENSQAAKHRGCSHWEHLAGILQTVAVVTHHSEATEQPRKTTSREGLAFSFQNKMGSGQGCIYQGSYPQPADTQDLFFWVFSENIPRYWN